MSWLQGGWRKLVAVCVLLFGLTVLVRDRQGNVDKLDQFQKRLLACTHHSDSLSSQLEVINNYKEAVERMMATEKSVSARVAQAYETKIQYLNAKNDNLQMQLNECQQNYKKTDDVVKLQTENSDYKKRIEDMEKQMRQLSEQLAGQVNMNEIKTNISNRVTISTTIKSTKPTIKPFVNPENHHEEAEIQPVDSPNFNVVPDTEIHFHKKPKQPLVYRRGGGEVEDNPAAIAELMPQEELLKKINDRKAKKDKANEENVEDFREMPEPDAHEMDYKEVDH